jgi:hypothetical protein
MLFAADPAPYSMESQHHASTPLTDIWATNADRGSHCFRKG